MLVLHSLCNCGLFFYIKHIISNFHKAISRSNERKKRNKCNPRVAQTHIMTHTKDSDIREHKSFTICDGMMHKKGSCGRPRGSPLVWVIMRVWATLRLSLLRFLRSFDRDIALWYFKVFFSIWKSQNDKICKQLN